jgi:hypothetical protein
MAEEESHDAALPGAQRQTPARGQVETAGVAADLGQDGGEAATAKPFLENPERLARTAHRDDEQPLRIESETIQSGPMRQAGIAGSRGFHHPEDRPAVVGRESGEDRRGETGRGESLPSAAADFMEGVPAKPARQQTVKAGNAEGKVSRGQSTDVRGQKCCVPVL